MGGAYLLETPFVRQGLFSDWLVLLKRSIVLTISWPKFLSELGFSGSERRRQPERLQTCYGKCLQATWVHGCAEQGALD